MKKITILILLLMAGTAQAGDSYIGNDPTASVNYGAYLWESARGSYFDNSGDSTGTIDTLGYWFGNDGDAETLTVALYYLNGSTWTFMDSTAWYTTTHNGNNLIKLPTVIGTSTLTNDRRYLVLGFNVHGTETEGLTYPRNLDQSWPPRMVMGYGGWGSISFSDSNGAVTVPGRIYFRSAGASPVDLTAFTWTSSDTSTAGRLQTSATFSNACDSLVYWRGTDTTATNRNGFTRSSVSASPTSPDVENTTGLASATWYQIDVLAYSGGALQDSMQVHGKTKWVAPDTKICPVIK